MIAYGFEYKSRFSFFQLFSQGWEWCTLAGAGLHGVGPWLAAAYYTYSMEKSMPAISVMLGKELH